MTSPADFGVSPQPPTYLLTLILTRFARVLLVVTLHSLSDPNLRSGRTLRGFSSMMSRAFIPIVAAPQSHYKAVFDCRNATANSPTSKRWVPEKMAHIKYYVRGTMPPFPLNMALQVVFSHFSSVGLEREPEWRHLTRKSGPPL